MTIAADSSKLEKAFLKGQKTLKLTDEYKVDFNLMIQHRIEVRWVIVDAFSLGACRIRAARDPLSAKMSHPRLLKSHLLQRPPLQCVYFY